jgi:predicted Zn-dependent protease
MNHSDTLRRSLLAIAASATLALVACGGQARYSSHLERGKQFLAQGNLDKAGVEFRNAAQIQPKAPEALYLNGRVAELRGDYRAALGLYQAVIDANPDFLAARVSLAKIYVFGGAPDRALQLVEPALAKHPDTPDLLVVRSAARAKLKNMAGAREDAEHAVRLAPGNEEAVSTLAGLLQQAGEGQQAIALVSNALTRVPTSVDLRQVLASLYTSAELPAKAEEQLRKIVELRPQELPRRYQLAYFFMRAHRLDDAQRVLEDAVKSAPQNAQAKLALVDFLTSQRSRAEAEKTLRDFIARQPDNYALRIGLGDLLQRNGAVPEALATFGEVAKLDDTGPNGLTARDRMAAIHVNRGEDDAAQKLIDVVLKKNPRDDQALLLRGQMELNRKEAAAAISDLRAVLRDEPNNIRVRRMIAAAFVANGQPGLAEEQLRSAQQTAPKDIGVRIDLARLLGRTGRGAAAVQSLEEGIRSAPSDASLREALVRAEIATGDFAAARKDLSDLDTLVPGTAIVPLLAGQIAQGSGQLADSVKDYEQALKLQPRNIEPLIAATKVDIDRGEGAAAVARVRSTLAADPQNPLRLNILAEALIATKAYPEATETLGALIKTSPEWSLPYHNLGMARILAGDQSGAAAAYEAGLKAIPFEPNLTYELAGLYEREGRADDAIAVCEALYRHSPQELRAASNLALLLVDHRRDQASLDRAQNLTAQFSTSNDPALLDALGWVQFKRGETTQALVSLERAESAAPGSAPTRYHLAMAQLRAGDATKARANLEAALAASSSFRGAADARVTLASLAPDRKGG